MLNISISVRVRLSRHCIRILSGYRGSTVVGILFLIFINTDVSVDRLGTRSRPGAGGWEEEIFTKTVLFM